MHIRTSLGCRVRPLLVVSCTALSVLGNVACAPAEMAGAAIRITVLSSRPDMVSGGDLGASGPTIWRAGRHR